MKLVVTIPALNEEKTIADVVAGVPRNIPGITQTDVIVVNDASTDQTAEMAEHAGAFVVNVHGRPGLGAIFRTGLERAMRRGADIIVNIDGDGQFNPADIAKLVRPLLDDEADFVTCTRFADPSLLPDMPRIKFYGNRMVTGIINWVCGGTHFTDVSCGFRALSRDAAYRMTLFGRFTYTQECFIDLFGKGMRIVEVPLKIRGVREHGKSRVASSVWRYAISSLPIILRAMRDIQPLKFFGLIALTFFIPGLMAALVVLGRYLYTGKTFQTSLIPISGVLITLSFVMGVLAMLADMLGRHRKITEELIYLARRRVYSSKRPSLPVMTSVEESAPAVARLFDEPIEAEASERVEPVEPIEPKVVNPRLTRQPGCMSEPAPRKFYDTEYHFQEDADRPDENRIRHALRHLQPLNGCEFLDLGCGAGWAARMASLSGAKRVAGLDFSRTALQLAIRHTPQVLWIQADGTALPFADDSFDRLFCNGSLEHFPDVRMGLRQIHRILRPDALAVLIVPNFYVRTEQPMEFRASYWNWKRLIEEAGFRIEKTGIDWGPPVLKNANLKRTIARLIGKLLCMIPYMQYQFIFVLRKPSA